MPQKLYIIVPCYNEEKRLAVEDFLSLARGREGLSLLFVDDGSKDGTAAVIHAMTQRDARISLHRLPQNAGKGEAIRQGMQAAITRGAEFVGYLDADLSTPAAEALKLIDTVRSGQNQVVMGSRIRFLGTQIHRSPHRHYLGRIFATLASALLEIPVYDTQCGAKFFRVSPVLLAALSEPFRSRWIFDVELLMRLLRGTALAPPLRVTDLREVPLQEWRDVAGSKLRLGGMVEAFFELLREFIRKNSRT